MSFVVDKKSLKKLFARDAGCWHCGVNDETLVPHHRLNRGMGGSPSRDTLANVILICSRYNGQVEDSSFWADRARSHGHKLRMGADPASVPVFNVPEQTWYLLDDAGNKRHAETELT